MVVTWHLLRIRKPTYTSPHSSSCGKKRCEAKVHDSSTVSTAICGKVCGDLGDGLASLKATDDHHVCF